MEIHTSRFLIFGFAALVLSIASLSACSGASPEYTRIVIDRNNSGDCKAVGDVDGDGKPDLIVGGSDLVWYRNPDWKKFFIAKSMVQFTTDCQAKDINGDTRLDIITADGNGANNVVWFENVDNGRAWVRHTIGTHGNWVHDIEVVDLDRDGKPDVITHGHGTHVWYQNTPDAWLDIDLSAKDKTVEGIGIGDVDGDGYIDFVQGGWWFQNPGGRSGAWNAFQFAVGYDGGSFTAVVGDLNGDGRVDIALSEQHKRHELAWYAGPVDPRIPNWSKHVVARDMGAHKLHMADMNGDGRVDLVVGLELKELSIFLNDGGNPTNFVKMRINSTGCHNTRVADVNGDGKMDIFCVNYIDHPPVELWLNRPSKK